MHKPNNGPKTRNQYKASLITLVTVVSRPTTNKEMAQSEKGSTSQPPHKGATVLVWNPCTEGVETKRFPGAS